MMKETRIAFFSSDARDLYKKDIFRVLSLPKGYVVHFRYDPEYLDFDPQMIAELVNEKAVVFFTKNNNVGVSENDRVVTNISIRSAKIVHTYQEDNSGLVHFFLKLHDFVDCRIAGEEMGIPPLKFVSKVEIIYLENDLWINRIKLIENDFTEPMLFLIDGIFRGKNNKRIKPVFSLRFGKSYYDLIDDRQYILKVSYYDSTGGSKSIDISEFNNLIYFDLSEKFSIEAIKDDGVYRLATKHLETAKASTNLTFSSGDNSVKYDMFLSINIKRSCLKVCILGFCSALLILGVVLINYAFKNSGTPNYWVALLGMIFTGVSPSVLYRILNKK